MSDDDRESSRDRTKRERPTRFSDTGRDRSVDRGKDRNGLKSSLCRVYVSNIPYEYRWQDLKDLFRSQVGDVSFVELFVDNSDKPRGCGIVEFADNASVKKCLEVMHRFELKGRKLVIKEDFGNQRDKFGNLVGTAASKRVRDRDDGRDRFRDERRTSGGFDLSNSQLNRSNQDMSDGKWGNTYGLSPQFLDSLGVSVPLISRVFIANLDYKVDKKKLKEIFRLAGKIQNIDLSSDRDGKSRGFAVLEYDHPVEAVQAVSMFNNQVLYDRVMTVRMDREGDRPMVKYPDGLKGMGMGLGSNGAPLKDVARNLPSLAQPTQQSTSIGTGILGSIPLGIGNTLSASALNTLSTNAAVLQAANLAGVGGLSANLLTNSFGGGDLGLTAANLVTNPLVQNQSFAAFTNSGNLGARSLNNSNFSRSDLRSNNQAGSGGYQQQSQNQNYLSGANRNYEEKVSDFKFDSSERESRNATNNSIYSSVNNGGQLLRSVGGNTSMNAGKSNKILMNNLPPTATYKMLNEKCNEFGDVQNIEDKGNNGVIVTFASQWEAENAIKNLDHARIDGRTIDVRFSC